MNDDPSLAAVLIARVAGAFSGAFLALVFIQPRTLREFVSRAVISVVSGLIFTHPIRVYLGWGQDIESVLAAATIAGFASWFVMGLIVRRTAKADPGEP